MKAEIILRRYIGGPMYRKDSYIINDCQHPREVGTVDVVVDLPYGSHPYIDEVVGWACSGEHAA